MTTCGSKIIDSKKNSSSRRTRDLLAGERKGMEAKEGESSIDVSDWLSKIDQKICSLDVSNLSLSDGLGEAIVRSLPATLVKLELGGNNFSSLTVSALAVLLKKNTSLQHISLDSNPLTSGINGIESLNLLAESLGGNTGLRTLSLWRCGIGLQGCSALFKALKHNTTLVSLEIGYNNCAGSDARSIKEQLNRNRKQYYDQLDAEARAKEVERNETLLKLQEQEKVKMEKDVVEWLADEKAKREESRRVDMERKLLKEQKEQAYNQRMEQINKMEEERKASKKKKKKGKKSKKKK